MPDYMNCPTCHGRGLVPLADAEPITAHAEANYQAANEVRRQREQAVLDDRLRRGTEAAEKRLAELEATVYGIFGKRS